MKNIILGTILILCSSAQASTIIKCYDRDRVAVTIYQENNNLHASITRSGTEVVNEEISASVDDNLDVVFESQTRYNRHANNWNLRLASYSNTLEVMDSNLLFKLKPVKNLRLHKLRCDSSYTKNELVRILQ